MPPTAYREPQRRTAPGRTASRPTARARPLRSVPPAPPPRRRLRRGGGRGDSMRRLSATLVLILVAVAVLAGRLVQVQGIEGPHYSALARDQRLHEIPLPAARGQILNSAGAVLAESVDARDIYADPEQIQAAGKTDPAAAMSPAAIAARISPLVGVPVPHLLQVFAEHEQFVYLARGLTPAVGNRIEALDLPGIGVLDSTSRVYPQGRLAANLIGFTGLDGTGLDGLEYADNSLLAGTPGRSTVETGADGRVIPDGRNVEVPARPGRSVELTIDSNIQWEADQVLTAQVKATRAASGSVIVMNPHTGQILALANAPSFDPNNAGATPPADWTDYAATDTYEPGSVEKAVTMSAALSLGLVNPMTVVTVPPTIKVGGTVFHDAESHGTERLTLTGVVAESSNIGTIEVALKAGGPALLRMIKAYGYGVPTGARLPGEASGYVPPLASWSATTLPTLAFGQGLSVTALQIASVYQTIANGGVRITPSIVKGVVGADGKLQPAAAPTERRVVSPAVDAQLVQLLEGVTDPLATAPAAYIPGYQVAGKTGTANRADGHGGYSGFTSSFVGFAPARHPQLLVEVVLDRPQTSPYGGIVAAPVFNKVMTFALEALHIQPPSGPPPVVRLTAP